MCVCLSVCAIMPRGGCWAVDRPRTMFSFAIERERDREGEMRRNRQNWREEVSIFGSCGLPYLGFFFVADISKAQYTHTCINTHPDSLWLIVTHHQSILLSNIKQFYLLEKIFNNLQSTNHPISFLQECHGTEITALRNVLRSSFQYINPLICIYL